MRVRLATPAGRGLTSVMETLLMSWKPPGQDMVLERTGSWKRPAMTRTGSWERPGQVKVSSLAMTEQGIVSGQNGT